MPDILQIADLADIVVNGYAYTRENNHVRVLNLNHPERACVITCEGDVLETSMDDIEIGIVQDYYARNKKYMEDE